MGSQAQGSPGTWTLLTLPVLPTALHQKVASNYLPTAIKFHYIFNLRDLSNIFQVVGELFLLKYPYSFLSSSHILAAYHVPEKGLGLPPEQTFAISCSSTKITLRAMGFVCQGLLFSTPECLRTPVDLVRLWLHEAERVYGDKLVDEEDQYSFKKLMTDICRASFQVSCAEK